MLYSLDCALMCISSVTSNQSRHGIDRLSSRWPQRKEPSGDCRRGWTWEMSQNLGQLDVNLSLFWPLASLKARLVFASFIRTEKKIPFDIVDAYNSCYVRGGIKKLFFYFRSKGEGGLGQSKKSLSENTQIFLTNFDQKLRFFLSFLTKNWVFFYHYLH